MKKNIRPISILLIIILLVVGANAVLYHMGMLDSFLNKMEEKSEVRDGEGPVVRKTVTNLVLPLESSPAEIAPVDGMNETDISSEDSTIAVETESLSGTPVSAANASLESNASSVAEESSTASVSVTEEKKEMLSKDGSKIAGIFGRIVTTCSVDNVTSKIPLSGTAGRVTWFNLQNPRKLVVDIRGRWENRGKSIYRLKGCPVEKIVVGEHSDKMRMVFYINKKDTPKRITPVIKKNVKGVTLSLNL